MVLKLVRTYPVNASNVTATRMRDKPSFPQARIQSDCSIDTYFEKRTHSPKNEIGAAFGRTD